MNVPDNHRETFTLVFFLCVTSWMTQSVSGQALFGRNSPSNFMFVSPSRYGASNPSAPSGEIIHKSSLPAGQNQIQYAGAGAARKPGYCPTAILMTSKKCADSCGDDNDCVGMKKCCRNGCGKRCTDPVHPALTPQVLNKKPELFPGVQASQLYGTNHGPNSQGGGSRIVQSTAAPQNVAIYNQGNQQPQTGSGVHSFQLYGANQGPNSQSGGSTVVQSTPVPQNVGVHNQGNQQYPQTSSGPSMFNQQHSEVNGQHSRQNATSWSMNPASSNGQMFPSQNQFSLQPSPVNNQYPAENNMQSQNNNAPGQFNTQSQSTQSVQGMQPGVQPVGYDPSVPRTGQTGMYNGQQEYNQNQTAGSYLQPNQQQQGYNQMDGFHNQTTGLYLQPNPQPNQPLGSYPSLQNNAQPNGNGQYNFNNQYNYPPDPNNQASGAQNQVPQQGFMDPGQNYGSGSSNYQHPYHSNNGAPYYQQPYNPNNQHSEPISGQNSNPYDPSSTYNNQYPQYANGHNQNSYSQQAVKNNQYPTQVNGPNQSPNESAVVGENKNNYRMGYSEGNIYQPIQNPGYNYDPQTVNNNQYYSPNEHNGGGTNYNNNSSGISGGNNHQPNQQPPLNYNATGTEIQQMQTEAQTQYQNGQPSYQNAQPNSSPYQPINDPNQNGQSQNVQLPHQNLPNQNEPSQIQYTHDQSANGQNQFQNVNQNQAHQNELGQNHNGPYSTGSPTNGSLQYPTANVAMQNPSVAYPNGQTQIQTGQEQIHNETYQNGPVPNHNNPHPNTNSVNGIYQPNPQTNPANDVQQQNSQNNPYRNPQSNSVNGPYVPSQQTYPARDGQQQSSAVQYGPKRHQYGYNSHKQFPYQEQGANTYQGIPEHNQHHVVPYNGPEQTIQNQWSSLNTQYQSNSEVNTHQSRGQQPRSQNVLKIRPYKVGGENGVVEIVPYDNGVPLPQQNESPHNLNQEFMPNEQSYQQTAAKEYHQNNPVNKMNPHSSGPNSQNGPLNTMNYQASGSERSQNGPVHTMDSYQHGPQIEGGNQHSQPQHKDSSPETAVKLKPSLYGSYKIIPYDMTKYGKSKPIVNNMSSNFRGTNSNMQSNNAAVVKNPETIPKPRGIGPWPASYDVNPRGHSDTTLHNQVFYTGQPQTYANVNPATSQHQMERHGFTERTTAGIAPRNKFSEQAGSYPGPQEMNTVSPAEQNKAMYPDMKTQVTIQQPPLQINRQNNGPAPSWNKNGQDQLPQISPVQKQNQPNVPLEKPGPRQPETISKPPSFANLAQTRKGSNIMSDHSPNNAQLEAANAKPTEVVRDPGMNQKGEITPGPNVKTSSYFGKDALHGPNTDTNPVNSINYKDTRMGKNYYDPMLDHASTPEIHQHGHFDTGSIQTISRPRNTFSLMGGGPDLSRDKSSPAPSPASTHQYNAANLGIVDYGQPRASAFEAQPVRRERMGLSSRGSRQVSGLSSRGSPRGSGLSISKFYHDVGHSHALNEPPSAHELSSEYREVTRRPTYRPPVDSLGQVFIDIARFPDNPMKAPPNPLSLSLGFRGHIPDIKTTAPPSDTTPAHADKKLADKVGSLNLLENPKTEKPAAPKQIIPAGMALTQNGSQPAQMIQDSRPTNASPRLGISSTLIGAPPAHAGPERKVFNKDGFNLFSGYKPQYKVPVKEIRNPSVRGTPVFSARAGKTLKKP